MEPRMKQPALILPDALRAMLALGKSAKGAGVPLETAYLVHLLWNRLNVATRQPPAGARAVAAAA